jgi:aryl-alcohol dehydrogenase-like predicted oxidoreductase
MRYLDLNTTKKISVIGLGTAQFGSREWGYGERYAQQEAYTIVRRAIELGLTLFDTAEIYAGGRSERILGHAVEDCRDSVVLATKIFPILPSAALVRQRAAASAKRLAVAKLDLYQVHWPNPLVSDHTLMRGMRSLQQKGLIGEVGVSVYSLDRWRAAEAALAGRILTNQVGYSLVDRGPERDLLPFVGSGDHAIIAFSPLAKGLLSSRYHRTDRPTNRVRATDSIFDPESLNRTNHLIDTLQEIAAAHHATPAQIALAWVIFRPGVAAIPGASSLEQLESNVAAAEIKLAEDEYQALNVSSAPFSPQTTVEAAAPRKWASTRRGWYERQAQLKHVIKVAPYLAKTVWEDHLESARQARSKQTPGTGK